MLYKMMVDGESDRITAGTLVRVIDVDSDDIAEVSNGSLIDYTHLNNLQEDE